MNALEQQSYVKVMSLPAGQRSAVRDLITDKYPALPATKAMASWVRRDPLGGFTDLLVIRPDQTIENFNITHGVSMDDWKEGREAYETYVTLCGEDKPAITEFDSLTYKEARVWQNLALALGKPAK